MKEVIDTVSVALANGDTENVGNVVMQEVNRTLLSAGVDEVWADKIDNLIVLLFIPLLVSSLLFILLWPDIPECPASASRSGRVAYRRRSSST